MVLVGSGRIWSDLVGSGRIWSGLVGNSRLEVGRFDYQIFKFEM